MSPTATEFELDARSAILVKVLAAHRGCSVADVIEEALMAYFRALDAEGRAEIEQIQKQMDDDVDEGDGSDQD